MIRKAIFGLVVLLVLVYGGLWLVPIEPNEQRPGVRLGGELATDQTPRWAFDGRKKIWVQTKTWYGLPHSVTTVSWIDGDQFYVPCRTCAGKLWSRYVAADPHVLLKIDGQLYARVAVPVTDEQERRRLLGVAADEPTPDVAVFRMDPDKR